VRVAKVRRIVFVDGLEPGEEIPFDDLALYRRDEQGGSGYRGPRPI